MPGENIAGYFQNVETIKHIVWKVFQLVQSVLLYIFHKLEIESGDEIQAKHLWQKEFYVWCIP